MRTIVQRPRRGALPIAVALAAALSAAPRLAAAQRPVVDADGTANVGFSQSSQTVFQADPNAEPEDIADPSVSRMFLEIRPGITIQSGAPRLIWRAGYQFAGNFGLIGDQAPSYNNQLMGALIALPSKYTSMTVNGTLAQGGTSFLLISRPAEAGQPEIRAPGNPNLISASLGESFSWDAGRRFALRQSLTGSASAPQDDFSEYNANLTATVGIDRQFERDSAGLELRASVSRLRPLRETLPAYASVTNALFARWNHDLSRSWNIYTTAGVEQVYTDTGSKPLAFLPSGSISALYTVGRAVAGLDLSHGTTTNIQVGTVAISDRIAARGVLVLNEDKLRALSFSAGFLHNEPIGEADTLVAAGTGNAIQGDASFTTAFAPNVLLNARYTVAYQYGQLAGIEASLAHIFLVGVTGRISNTKETRRPMPVRGRRVDGSDGLGFPAGGNPVGGEDGGSPP